MKKWTKEAQRLMDLATTALAQKPRKIASDNAEVVVNAEGTEMIKGKGTVEAILTILNNLG